jgi:hypothetical protein
MEWWRIEQLLRSDLPNWFEQRRRGVAMAAALLLLMLAGLGGWAWWSSRWKPPPSIFDTPVDGVLGYLAIDDFNRLPLEERVRFMIDFANRFRGLAQSESAVMAAFLAGLTGNAREQLTQNARTLAKDILAEGASAYVNLPPRERAAFIDDWLVRWSKVGEEITRGEVRNRSDEDRIAEFRREAERGPERAARQGGDLQLTEVGAARFLSFWQSDVEKAASPREQAQITRFMVDVRKHLTGGL